ncbi:MAG: hypothetical protein WCJ49_04650 [Deltaproteobacteria bacterium]
MSKTEVTSIGDNCGFLGGLANVVSGEHAYEATINHDDGSKSTGYGHNSKEAIDNANANASRK